MISGGAHRPRSRAPVQETSSSPASRGLAAHSQAATEGKSSWSPRSLLPVHPHLVEFESPAGGREGREGEEERRGRGVQVEGDQPRAVGDHLPSNIRIQVSWDSAPTSAGKVP